MKYFLDTEFIEYPNTIQLISIGIISEDNREYYAVNKECNCSKANDWVVKNVLNKMPEFNSKLNLLEGKTLQQIKEDLKSFCKDDICEFYGYYSDYDWVVFCWIFGTMVELPANFPKYCIDLKQMMDQNGYTKEWKKEYCPDPIDAHNALVDAKWNKKLFELIKNKFVD